MRYNQFEDRMPRRSSRTGRFIRGEFDYYPEDYEDRYYPGYNARYDQRDPYFDGRQRMRMVDTIGFAGSGEIDDMESFQPRYTEEGMPSHLTKRVAKEWVSSMSNADRTKGGKWTMEQTKNVMDQKGYSCDEADFYAAMNMIYSDFGPTLKKFGISTTNTDAYAELAKAFLDDDDAFEGKMVRYFGAVVEH